MKLVRNLRWALTALGILGGSTNAFACVVTPDSILTEGQTLQLIADCTNGGIDRIKTINWKMAIGTGTPVSLTGDVSLNQPVPKKIYYTTPVGLTSSGTGEYTFSVTGTYADNAPVTTVDTAKVVVMPSSAAIALAQGVATPTTPIPAHCGSANGTAVTTMPTGTAQCSSGTGSLAISGPSSFTWTCLSLNGGTEDNCYAMRSVVYTVTATDNGSTNGSVSPTTQQVPGGSSATVTATPAATYNTSWSSTCGGTPNGNSFNISSVNANCTVTASFGTAPAVINGSCGTSNGGTFSVAPTTSLCSAGTASSVTTGTSTYSWSCAGTNGGTTASCSATRTVAPPPPVGDDPGVGSGLWAPGGSTTRTVADPSGPEINRIVSYVPGCLNGLAANNSAVGCAVNSSYTATLAGTTTSRTVSLVSGKELLIRYRPKANAGTSVKGIYVSSATGGSVGPSMKVWLSTDPTATYDSVPAACRDTSTSFPSVTTGPGYCPISTSNPVYYFGFETSSTTPLRFKVQESQSDLY